MNFSESRQNRSKENREKSKNRFFLPPLFISIMQILNIYQFTFFLIKFKLVMATQPQILVLLCSLPRVLLHSPGS